MDLRSFIKSGLHREEAERLIANGLFNYQPFIFSDDIEVGAGYEFIYGEYSGLIRWPAIPDKFKEYPLMKKFLIRNENEGLFRESNQRLRVMYDSFINEICNRVGDVSQTTFVDIGCNSGYFPVGFSLRGAKKAVGYDRGNFTATFKFLNEILDTDAQFIYQPYEKSTHSIPGCKKYDVVTSIAVICHLSDPLFHLNFLGSIADKALFIWTPLTNDDDYCIRFGEPNKYYKSDDFPWCFDNLVLPSEKLLRKSLELMGFQLQYEIPNQKDGMPDVFYNSHKALLAIRTEDHRKAVESEPLLKRLLKRAAQKLLR